MKLPRRHTTIRRCALWAALLLAASAGAWWMYATYIEQPETQLRPVVSQQSKLKKPKASQKEFAPIAETPVSITIDAIGVKAAIEPVGLTSDGMMDAPKTNEGVGWYDKSARAGEDDFSVLLDGHYGTDAQPAVFYRLAELVVGDTVTLHGEKGTKLLYKLVEIEQRNVRDVDMKKALYPYRNGKQSLTIITCEGLYDVANDTYDKRTIVYAERVL